MADGCANLMHYNRNAYWFSTMIMRLVDSLNAERNDRVCASACFISEIIDCIFIQLCACVGGGGGVCKGNLFV
jgi:hypothetical protein